MSTGKGKGDSAPCSRLGVLHAYCKDGRCAAIRSHLRSMCGRGESLDDRLRRYEEHMHRMSDSSVFFCSRPVEAILSKKSFLMVLLFLSLMFFLQVVGWTERLTTRGRRRAQCFRFSVRRLRNGRECEGPVNVNGIGMLEDESDVRHSLYNPLPLSPLLVDSGNCTLLISYPRPVDMNGFFIVTGEDREELDPLRFLLEGSACDGAWETVGGSGWRFDWRKMNNHDRSVFSFTDEQDYSLPLLRNATSVLLYHVPVLQTSLVILLNLTRALVMGVPAVLGLCSREKQGKQAVQCGSIGTIVFLSLLILVDGSNATSLIADLLLAIGFLLCLVFFEDETHFWVSSVLIFSSWCASGFFLSYSPAFHAGLLISLSSIAILLYRDHVISTSCNIVEHDRSRYESGWRLFLLYLGQLEHAKKLSKFLRFIVGSASIQRMQADELVRQAMRRRTLGFRLKQLLLPAAVDGVMQVDGEGNPVCSLQRLYAQAAVLRVLLARKVRRWARASGGYFVVKDEEGRLAFVTWDEACQQQKLREEGRWLTARDGEEAEQVDRPGRRKGTLAAGRRTRGGRRDQWEEWEEVMADDEMPENRVLQEQQYGKGILQQQQLGADEEGEGNKQQQLLLLLEEEEEEEEEHGEIPSCIVSLKPRGRAVEKVMRSYGGQVGRLLDVCRTRIVFDDIGGVSMCVAGIKRDREVDVLRVKNRMTERVRLSEEEGEEEGEETVGGRKEGDSLGRRDVILNLALRSEEAAALGVSRHVCEVQLEVVTMAALRTEEAHQRYVQVRNLRRR
ncbi:hypothetical protein GUITHDRAFT_147320 [Guillardia theta CCMP2712]|uniref:Uncharacterized protein n=1 Tax=Guillardia theta (strain CCMP2712) TaxID=905079 RepID=L1IDY4_GUITC|nr:hypothetical protein GUITHDRAFT_147320 [Guillardia theta CCMP2712]EKX34282.1 hypothetical protein GUITHDRAFT_147320 [Guillardia theta CCMP2712]|eukprot:XP_005821262.1 hypothetical protein GUITHDRAFT_147320 [Guillardia theta CCMP2712]